MERFFLALALLAFASPAANLLAQRYDPRVDVPEIVNAGRDHDGDRRGDWEMRNRADLDRLNADVARVRAEIGNSRDKEVRGRFHEVVRATDRLNALYNRRQIRGWELRQRIDNIRGNLEDVRRLLDSRYERRDRR